MCQICAIYSLTLIINTIMHFMLILIWFKSIYYIYFSVDVIKKCLTTRGKKLLEWWFSKGGLRSPPLLGPWDIDMSWEIGLNIFLIYHRNKHICYILNLYLLSMFIIGFCPYINPISHDISISHGPMRGGFSGPPLENHQWSNFLPLVAKHFFEI